MPTKFPTVMTPVGKTIRRARLEKKFTHANLANATGLSVDYLKKIESGKARAPVGTLLQIARALQIDSSTLLKAKAASNKERINAFTKRNENDAYKALTPGATNNRLQAFRLKIESHSQHEGVGYQHQGEEFIFVLSGYADVIVGQQTNSLKTGESLLFNSNIKHKIKNNGDTPCELLVVIYIP